ncbi:IS110 family transposase [Treponema primitia]|uniref:IS110 family transposase n=1 Tax=Treponema primitia TaxID=88058 RepID=UPI0039803388
MKERRYVGIDVGKRTYAMAVIGKAGAVTHSNGKTSDAGRAALWKKLQKTDKVAIEAGNMAFIMAKEILAQVGCEVVVLNASRLALIYGSMKKTDKEDSLKLARIIEQFRDDQLPSVPLPSDQEMRRRKLIASHSRAVKLRTQMINTLHGLFLHQGITTVVAKDLATTENREAAVKQLTGLEREEAEWTLEVIEHCEKRMVRLDKHMAAERKGDKQIERIMEVPGVGPVVSLAFVAFLGDGSRFENASQVSNYLGLVPRVDMSGTIVKYGGITKRGNKYLRSLLVQASWAVMRSKQGSALKERYEYMTVVKGLGKKKAIVAIARRLAELLWTLLRSGTDYEPRKFTGPSKGVPVEKIVTEALAS